MPNNYSGNPNNITTPLVQGIISCASGAGGLVLVGTSSSHMFSTFDYVRIVGVTGTVEANGVAPIQVIDSTTFLLTGVPFVNSYSGGGSASDISLTPSVSFPQNGEPATVDAILTALQVALDRTQFLAKAIERVGVIDVHECLDAVTTIVVPAGVYWADIEGCGGGGQGGGGGDGDTTSDMWSGGGGGGGGATKSRVLVPVVPGETLTVTLGAGGITPDVHENGSPGGASVVQISPLGHVLATFQGGDGGGHSAISTDNTGFAVGRGGTSIPTSLYGKRAVPSIPSVDTFDAWVNTGPSQGAPGLGGDRTVLNAFHLSGNLAPSAPGLLGFTGGSSGTLGADSGSYRGGGRGGGGGAGPWGPGGAGGNGGNAAGSGFGGDGAMGTAGSLANFSGAGGGGGGGGGASPGTGGTGGAGGAGGYGRVIVRWSQLGW